MRRIVAYDLGTNTFRWFYGVFEEGSFHSVRGGREIVGLGRGLKTKGAIESEDLRRAEEVLRKWVPGCGVVPEADRAGAFATHVFRVSRNGEEVRQHLESVLGVGIRILSPEEEARFAFLGVRQGLLGAMRAIFPSAGKGLYPSDAPFSSRIGFLDIGGGSSEVGYGREELEEGISVPIGVVTRRPQEEEPLGETIERIQREFFPYLERLKRCELWGIGVNCGTATALAMEYLRSPYDPALLHGVFVPLEWLKGWVQSHRDDPPTALKGCFFGYERAELIAPGIGILLAVLEYFQRDGFWNSETGVLEGYATDLATNHPADSGNHTAGGSF